MEGMFYHLQHHPPGNVDVSQVLEVRWLIILLYDQYISANDLCYQDYAGVGGSSA